MPYIKSGQRILLQPILDDIDRAMRLVAHQDRAGVANYLITETVARAFTVAQEPWNYERLNAAHGTFASAGAEFYRRLVVPYEGKKIEENGDISAYKQ